MYMSRAALIAPSSTSVSILDLLHIATAGGFVVVPGGGSWDFLLRCEFTIVHVAVYAELWFAVGEGVLFFFSFPGCFMLG